MFGNHLSIVFVSLVLTTTSFLGALASSIDSCPGYTATNIQNQNGKITADLSLAGDACDVYGTDLPDLRLLVEYQTSTLNTIGVIDNFANAS